MDEIHLDPFIRRHLGKNGAFVCRENPSHVKAVLAFRNMDEQDRNELLIREDKS